MAQKIYLIENLDCANCAAKIEAKLNALEDVEQATVTFATGQLRVSAADPDALLERIRQVVQSVEPDARVVERKRPGHPHKPHGHHHHDDCCHDHGEHEHCHHDHKEHEHDHHHEEHEHDHHDHEEHEHDHHDHEEHEHCHDHEEHEHDHHDHGAHEDAHHHGEEKEGSVWGIVLGAVLFACCVVLEKLGLDLPGLLVAIAAYFILGRGVVLTAVRNLTKGIVFDENFLMSLATVGAFFIGEYPEAVGVMLFYRIGEFFEDRAVERSRRQIMDAVDLRPEVVNLADGEEVRVIPAEDARPGDLVLVRPGDRIPLDGVVVSGESRIDTSPITGEPVPVSVFPGSAVISGCVNTAGSLTVRVEKTLEESMVTRILDSVENAAASKPKIDRFITRFARIYTPVVVAVAAATAVIPSLVTGNWNYWVYTALSFLVMSCPCALVLSVPLAFFSGIGAGSKLGILFKGGATMEAMGKIKAVVMDKTGTLTRGDFVVQHIEGDVLGLCASCEQQSTHPIAQSITDMAQKQGVALERPEELEELAGRGIRARLNGQTVLCGNARLLEENGVSFTAPDPQGGSLVLVAVDGCFRGFLLISDTLKPGAKETVDALKQAGIKPVMLTGDSQETALAVAQKVGIGEVHGRLLPHQKLELLQKIRSENGSAMFVGDGINDAPVLAGADVGAAMGSGADAAIEAADVVFMTSDVSAIAQSLRIARETTRIAWQNVVFALVIKIAVMILGLCGFASMWLAVFADSGVAMLCVLNAIRGLYVKQR